VNDSSLHVVSESVLNPTPEQVDLELVTWLHNPSSHNPDLDHFEASLYLKDSDVPFVSFTSPAINGKNGTEATVKQTVPIQNMTEFTRYTMVTLASDTYTVYLRGKGGLKLGGLPKTTVDYNQEIEIQGKCCD
jgi:hypothetical protein